ncbi:hypothetical protein BKA66DRAFT_428841 [Pyrenochaeta sp. MPI-SDFR-AT-0127]|nr:hypothetical protein BKA66DRAFT_428841 [Pyrenochaeta sp. MPI-SDFR-AT-0127]
MMPLHDQGRFHTALDAHAVADPEPIDRILDIDLGRHQITPSGRTEFPYCNHEMVAYLRSVASCRKELVCSSCFKNHQEEPLRTCSCTLRKRFLDQWICVPCYKMHYESDANVGKCMNHNYNRTGANSCKCRCGATLDEYTEYDAICNWCEGWIGDAVDDNNSDEENDTPEPIEEEQDEDHSAADFEDVAEDTFGFAVNRDGTVSAYTNGTSFRGERLGRGLVLEWMFKRGEDIPCSCCLCEVGEESISEESHTVGEEESDMDSADGEDESDMDSAHGEDMPDSHTASDDEDSGL